MRKEDILFIPGWMEEGKFYGYPNSLDIWTKKNLDLNCKFNEDLIVAHSAGSLVALVNWKNNKDSKLILFGPMIPKRHPIEWLYRWIKFILKEGPPPAVKKLSFIKNLPLGFRILMKLQKIDSLELIKKIPKDKLIIVRGSKDHYFCDEKISNSLKEEGFNVVEIKNIGHNWKKEVDNFLSKNI
jgi:hypothetical protein